MSRPRAFRKSADFRAWLEKNHPKYFSAPTEWTPPEQSIGVWNYTKRIIDERRPSLKEGQTPFSR